MMKKKLPSSYALVLLATAATLSASDLNFQAPHSILTGENVSLLKGDFNGDGKPDLLVQNWGAPVQVMLSNGNGTFRIVQGTDPDLLANCAVVGDFNGDGKLDVAIGSEDPVGVTVLLGDGNGHFYGTPIVTTTIGAVAMAAGDVNGDGILDLVIIPFPADGFYLPMQVLLGKGNGEFQNPMEIPSSLINGFQPTLIDVNHDGVLDLVYGYTSEVVTQLGTGGGTFGDPMILNVSGGGYPMAVADLNGDGIPDFAMACTVNSLASICVGLGNGDGTFSNAGSTVVANLPGDLATGDFNEDGHVDLVMTGEVPGESTTGIMTVLLGKGDGTFPRQNNYYWDGAGNIVVADWNGDGHPDLAVGNASGLAIEISFGDGLGDFVALSSPSAGPGPIPGIASADLNGDGKTDLAVVNGSGGVIEGVHEVDILIGNGDGTFQPPAAIQVGVNPQKVAIADLNHDGIPDLIVTDSGAPAGVWVLLGDGGGTYKAPVYYSSPVLVGIVAKDVNGDGVPDLVGLSSAAAEVEVWIGNGDGTFQTGKTSAAGTSPEEMATGDFNGDGKLDIAVTEARGDVVMMLPGNGDGTFGAPVAISTVAGPRGIVAGDFNGDGIVDLAVAAEGIAAVQVLLANGDGTFQPQTPVALRSNAIELVVADFMGNGNPGLAVTGRYSFEVTVLLGNGAGQFQVDGIFDPGGYPAGLCAANLNGDGDSLAIIDQSAGSTGNLAIMLNTSNH